MTRLQLLDNLAYRMKVTKKGADADLTDFLYSIYGYASICTGIDGGYCPIDGRLVVKGFGSFKING